MASSLLFLRLRLKLEVCPMCCATLQYLGLRLVGRNLSLTWKPNQQACRVMGSRSSGLTTLIILRPCCLGVQTWMSNALFMVRALTALIYTHGAALRCYDWPKFDAHVWWECQRNGTMLADLLNSRHGIELGDLHCGVSTFGLGLGEFERRQ